MATRDASIHTRIPSDLRAALEAIAAREECSLSDIIVRALRQWTRVTAPGERPTP